MDGHLGVDIESLLANGGWVRALAVKLVGDADLADDIVQQTWLAALEKPPRKRSSGRAWLGSVVRRLAARTHRDRYLRQKHESNLGQDARIATASEVTEIAEQQRQVVAHVLALGEPYRSTVLFRYFHDLTPSEIARQQGVPAATVRTWLRRALTQLRERIQAEEHECRPLALVLLPLLALPVRRVHAGAIAAGMVKTGAALMNAKKVVSAVVVTLLILTGVHILSNPEPARTEQEHATAEEPVADTSSDVLPTDREPAASPLRQVSTPAVIRGEIRTLSGNAFPDAPIELWNETQAKEKNAEPLAGTLSGQQGRFAFVGVSAGSYRIAPGKDDQVEAVGESVIVTAGKEGTTEATLVAEPHYPLSGTVVLEGTDVPVSDVWISFRRVDGGQFIGGGKSGEDGRFVSEKYVPGVPGVIVCTGGRNRWLSDNHELPLLNLKPGSEFTTDLVLEHPWLSAVDGVVVDSEDRPVANAQVRVLKANHFNLQIWENFWENPMLFHGVPEVRTDRFGGFSFSNLPDDSPIVLVVRADGFAPAITEDFRASPNPKGRSIRLPGPATIRGNITLPDGTPVGGAVPYLRSVDGKPGFNCDSHPRGFNSRFHRIVRSDEHGDFELVDVAPGRYIVGAWNESLRQEPSAQDRKIDARAGEVTVVSVVLLPPPGSLEISGLIVDTRGNPLANVRVAAQRLDARDEPIQRGAAASENTAEDGRFVIRDLEPGRYRLTPEKYGRDGRDPLSLYVYGASAVANAGEQNHVLMFDAIEKRVKLRVLDADTDKPILAPMRPYVTMAINGNYSGCLVDQNGELEYLLPVGKHWFFTGVRGRAPQPTFLQIHNDSADQLEVTIHVPVGRELSGRVVNPKGEPAADVKVAVAVEFPAGGWRIGGKYAALRNTEVFTDKDGSFLIDSLPDEGGYIGIYNPRLGLLQDTVVEATHDGLVLFLPGR